MSMASLAPSTAAPGSRLQVLGASPSGPARPKFNSHVTSDRLREGAGLYLPSLFRTPSSNIRKGRVSVFKELGLDDLTVSQVPIDDLTVSQVPIDDLTVSQVPIDDKYLGGNTAVYSTHAHAHAPLRQ